MTKAPVTMATCDKKKLIHPRDLCHAKGSLFFFYYEVLGIGSRMESSLFVCIENVWRSTLQLKKQTGAKETHVRKINGDIKNYIK